ncbi:hypothetical protein M427DRAFT_447477, partial [Gonapodya prolifera JEL478]
HQRHVCHNILWTVDIGTQIFYGGAPYSKLNQTLIGSGGKKGVVFAKQATTSFVLPFSLKRNMTTFPDDVMFDILDNCGFFGNATATNTIRISYKATVNLAGLPSIKKTISGAKNINCPVTGAQIASLLEKYGPIIQQIGKGLTPIPEDPTVGEQTCDDGETCGVPTGDVPDA